MTFANERKYLKILILRVLDSYGLFFTGPRDRVAPLYTVQINLKLICCSSPPRRSSECLSLSRVLVGCTRGEFQFSEEY